MGDARYKLRKRNEWIANDKCPRCGRDRQEGSKWCKTCAQRQKERVEAGGHKNREKPRTDGNYLYA